MAEIIFQKMVRVEQKIVAVAGTTYVPTPAIIIFLGLIIIFFKFKSNMNKVTFSSQNVKKICQRSIKILLEDKPFLNSLSTCLLNPTLILLNNKY